MRGLAGSLLVLTLAAGLVAGVIYLERTYAPHAAGPAADLSARPADGRAADADEPPLDAPPAPGRPADWHALADLAGRLPWNLAAPKASMVASAVGWIADAIAGRWRPIAPPKAPPGAPPGAAPVEPVLAGRPPAEAAALRPLPEFDETDANRPARLQSAADEVRPALLVQDAAHRPPAPPLGELRRADLFDLLRQLRAVDPQTVAAARTELVRRGLSEVDLELGRRLFDPDPEVRRQLVRALPNMQSVDAASWLLRLCRDEDPEVRMAAVTLMGTTGDLRLLEQLEAMIEHDPDARIRELAEQIAQQREIIGARAGGAAMSPPRMARGGSTLQK
jgi:hypothetical protein